MLVSVKRSDLDLENLPHPETFKAYSTDNYPNLLLFLFDHNSQNNPVRNIYLLTVLKPIYGMCDIKHFGILYPG